MPENHEPASGSLLAQSVLVVEQKKSVLDVSTNYRIFDGDGNQIGAVRQVDQGVGQKLLRFVSNFDKFLKFAFEVTDTSGNVVLKLTRPAKIMKSQLHVTDGAGNAIGEIVQENVLGKKNFSLVSEGGSVGEMAGKNWRDRRFTVTDIAGKTVAQVSKRFEGLRGVFHAEDKYVVRLEDHAEEPLRTLAIAASVCLDVALHQEEG
jgi:uncharacterized protein YxjI